MLLGFLLPTFITSAPQYPLMPLKTLFPQESKSRRNSEPFLQQETILLSRDLLAA